MTAYQNGAPRDRSPRLSPEHRRTHEVESAIARDVLEESEVFTITHGRQLPRGFSGRQRNRAPGALYRVHRLDGGTAWVFRPDEADPENPGLKYEATCKALGGPGNVLYIHPSQRHLIADTRVPVIFVEGIKKTLAIVSAARAAGVEVLVVGVLGVWNFLSKGKPIPDMLGIPLDGRKVGICYDSDVFTNPDVADAARCLAGLLIGRGAVAVELAYLPAGPGGSKTGADDFHARGNGYRELAATFKPFDATDLAAERLRRGDLLRAMLEDLRRAFWAGEWKGMGGHSSRDVFKVLVDAAVDRSKLHRDGLRVRISRGELARMAKVSTRTLQKAIERLEEMGLIYRDNEGRRPRQSGAFVLRAGVNRYGEGTARRDGEAGVSVSSLHLRAPRLRWSSPAVKGRRGVVKDTRRVRLSLASSSRPPVKRLGKIRGAVVDALDAAGGSLTAAEICGVLKRSRPRDLKRRVLPMLEDARIIVVDGDLVTLAENWLERLEEARDLGGELEAERLARARHKRKSRAYHARGKIEPTPHWTNTSADGALEDLEPEGMGPIDPKPEPEMSPAARTVLDYVRRLGRIRLGLLERIWLEDHGGDLAEMRRAIDEAGIQRERLPEFRNAEFLYPPAEKGAAA
jgi:Domain of unknown function (DUF3854)